MQSETTIMTTKRVPTAQLTGATLVWALLHAAGDKDTAPVPLRRNGVPEVWASTDVRDVTDDASPRYSQPPYVDAAGAPTCVGEGGRKLSLSGSPIEMSSKWFEHLLTKYQATVGPVTDVGDWVALSWSRDRRHTGASPQEAVARFAVACELGEWCDVPAILLSPPDTARPRRVTALRAPNGAQIIGTVEVLHGVAGLVVNTVTVNPDTGRLCFQYEGETTVHWNSQTTVTKDDVRVFEDEFGTHWLETQLAVEYCDE